jgi:hypothetical protein
MVSIADVQAALAANETKETTIIGLLQTAQLQKDTLAQHRRQDDRRQHRHGRGDRQHYAYCRRDDLRSRFGYGRDAHHDRRGRLSSKGRPGSAGPMLQFVLRCSRVPIRAGNVVDHAIRHHYWGVSHHASHLVHQLAVGTMVACVAVPLWLTAAPPAPSPPLARLRGFAGFSVRHPLPINELAGKVCTTAGGE